MTINIKHKHASHVIIIEGQAFKANDSGMWDLTDIWQTLKLPKGKAPGQWRTREAERLLTMQNLHSERAAKENRLHATKRATLEYAGWVSPEFKDVVYDAFEAILEMPEVALLVADKMRSMGNDHSAAILERHVFNDRCDWNALKGFKKAPKRPLSSAQREQQKYLRQAKAHEKANPIR
ncbi:hypothetical protein ALP50_03128 [Pseudomonas syringae pv. spinaceae]|uniref:Uncharacterized protein n=1 Tax=Pseudomonas syringae pv. spinaceae TaxID=264459 RepID=A0A0Q0CDK5_PSESX|nr:hypothetical protein [Pseudomonas syringae]KPY83356.1 Uncharacterized protein ALO94_02685 [Pseudomonas syringae pv. spinaceae]RMT38260.1 hypothetical protein ALP50_03128 [Pseudomonas syringae pv. spinaceae]